MAQVRTATLSLLYQGVDISADISPYLLSAEYTDSAEDKADDLQITLEDRKGLWRGGWFPEKGAKVTAGLVCNHWRKPGETLSFDMGSFEIDEIEVSGPPAVVTLKAVSSLITKNFTRENKNRGWEHIRLDAIARKIAEAHGFALYFDTDATIEFDRVDQTSESDSAFLRRLCNESGLSIKIANEKLIIFDQKKYDARPAVKTIARTGGTCIGHRFSSKSHDVYKACTVTYSDPVTKEDKTYSFSPPGAPVTGRTLQVNKRVESLAAAQAAAIHALRGKNKQEMSGDITLFGDPGVRAGLNVALAGFGVFDGNWHIEEARHAVGAGYTTTATIRKVLAY